MLRGPRNMNLKDVYHGGNQENQKKLLERIVTALTSNQSFILGVLIEKPFWNDQLIDPDIKLPLGNGKSVTEQIENGHQGKNIDPLDPQSWITPLQYAIVSDLATTEKLKLINILLANGTNPFGQDQDGNDALHYAVKYALALDNPDIEVIERLIQADAQADIPNKYRLTCMHLVSDIENDQKRLAIAKILIRCEPHMDVIE